MRVSSTRNAGGGVNSAGEVGRVGGSMLSVESSGSSSSDEALAVGRQSTLGALPRFPAYSLLQRSKSFVGLAPSKVKRLKRHQTHAVLRLTRNLGLEHIPPDTLREYGELFDLMDEDQNGILDRGELGKQFFRAGIDVDSDVLDSVVGTMEDGAAAGLDKTRFAKVMHAFSIQLRDVAPFAVYGSFDDDPEIQREALAHTSCMAWWQHSIWRLLEDPSSSQAATVVSGIIMVLIALSSVAFVMESDASPTSPGWITAYTVVDILSVSAFTVEYCLRLLTCPNKQVFLTSAMNTVDLMAILPFYVEQVLAGTSLNGSQVLRVLRLVRVFRVVKVSRYLTWLKVFARTFVESIAPLGMIAFIAFIATVVFSAAIYYAERDVQLTPSSYQSQAFTSIPMATWWCIVTMTTVGYGDMVPSTAAGQLVAVATTFAGILILAIPISVIAANFHQEYQASLTTKLLMERHRASDFEVEAAAVVAGETGHWSCDYLVSGLSLLRSNRTRVMTALNNVERSTRDSLTGELHSLSVMLERTVDNELAGPALPPVVAALLRAKSAPRQA